ERYEAGSTGLSGRRSRSDRQRRGDRTMSIRSNTKKAGWVMGGVAAALAVGASMGFTLRGPSATPYFSADLPVRIAPEVRGHEIAQLTAPPFVPGPLNRNYPTTVEVNLEVIEQE